MSAWSSATKSEGATAGQGTSGNEMSCSMNGYKALVADFITVATALIAANIAIITSVLPPDLAMSVDLLYQFLVNSGSWIGYIIAAAYFFGEDFGYGEYLCLGSQYLYKVVYLLKLAATLGTGA